MSLYGFYTKRESKPTSVTSRLGGMRQSGSRASIVMKAKNDDFMEEIIPVSQNEIV